jgi:hypothetical protein
MKPFEHPAYTDGWKCPICGTNKDAPVVLVKVDDTFSRQYHLECIELREETYPRKYYFDFGTIDSVFRPGEADLIMSFDWKGDTDAND